jgi:hypothetical protein
MTRWRLIWFWSPSLWDWGKSYLGNLPERTGYRWCVWIGPLGIYRRHTPLNADE